MAPSPGFRVLGRSEPGHGGQWKESHVPARDDERVGDTLEAADLHGEVIQTLGLALFLGPRRADPLPESLAAHRCGRPDDRCSRGHLAADYPAMRMRDKTFFSRH